MQDCSPDWDAFHGEYGRWLRHVAAGCLTRHGALCTEFESPDELVNAFLAEKVFPPRQARLMLGTPARRMPIASASSREFAEFLRRSATISALG